MTYSLVLSVLAVWIVVFFGMTNRPPPDAGEEEAPTDHWIVE